MKNSDSSPIGQNNKRRENFHLSSDFEELRPYLRSFYIEGFHDKNGIGIKSSTSYTEMLKRIEKSVRYKPIHRQEYHNKVYYLPVDSRDGEFNPLYHYWHLSTFTDGQLITFFCVMDILNTPGKEMNVKDILEGMNKIYDQFDNDKVNVIINKDQLTKELEKLARIGVLNRRIEKKKAYYSRTPSISLEGVTEALRFFSEVSPCGNIGSQLIEGNKANMKLFRFKHHYITSALDSEILADLLFAIRKKCSVTIKNRAQTKSYQDAEVRHILPLKIYISVQTGRQYVIAYDTDNDKICPLRLDRLFDLKVNTCLPEVFSEKAADLSRKASNMFGVNCKETAEPSRAFFVIQVKQDEMFVVNRLKREGRNGSVTEITEPDAPTRLFRYDTPVYDETELFGWIRSFIGRIKDVGFSSDEAKKHFLQSVIDMQALYIDEEADYV